MVVGLGTGSTVHFALIEIGDRLADGRLKNIIGIPTSNDTMRQANELSIPLTTFDDHPEIDLTIDGADEIDPQLNVIKGGGGALLREKIVAQASDANIIIADESKFSDMLGTVWPVPVEILPSAKKPVTNAVEKLDGRAAIRKKSDGSVFVTDQNNWILDCHFRKITHPHELARQLEQIAGILEHGLFLDLATKILIAEKERIRTLDRT